MSFIFINLNSLQFLLFLILIVVAFCFIVGQEIKSRILVSHNGQIFRVLWSCRSLTLKTASVFHCVGDKSCRGLCPPVHELHECHFCRPEAGKSQSCLSALYIFIKWKTSFVFVLNQNILIDACVLDSDSGLLQQVHVSGHLQKLTAVFITSQPVSWWKAPSKRLRIPNYSCIDNKVQFM